MNDILPQGSVKSSLRTLLILELFASERRTLALVDIARSLSMPKSSCLALLNTLTDRGYLYRAAPDGRYYPTKRWLNNATRIAEHDPLAAHIHACLERLAEATGETAIHAVLAGDQSVYVDVVESSQTIRFSTRSGDTKPLHVSASGRAELGVLAPEKMMEIVDRIDLKSMSNRRNFSRKSLVTLITEERQRGWSCNLGDHRADVLSIAVGLDLNGAAHSVLVAAPLARAASQVDKIADRLVLEARALMQQLL